jgi:hypothetical protein
MKEALGRMFSSMKVWTVIIGGLVTAGGSWLASHQLEISDAAVQQFAGTCALLVGILVHAQGKTDAGKEAVKLNLAAADLKREYDATGTPVPAAPVITIIPEEKKP